MRQQTFEHFTCKYYRKNWTNFYTITNTKTWNRTSKRRDGDENPDKSAKFTLVLDYIYEKKHNEMLKFYKKTNDYGLAWKLLKKTEIYKKLENEKNLLLANI